MQSQGSGKVTVHVIQGWKQKLQMGSDYRIEYDDGNVTVIALDS